ncbi:Protein-lysine N-methyltransferase EEF2KMT [Pseudolycoriella hygida]|uniref:Protein-lysine N-methyltransferase EEF2KMT n=1 Tax=Pseudolycoriella hygida TaxID=35572 RepID=A0A9Q0S069_9DIPT|nr:Protein-lysine N-methyltransferase EEF2KMT [Pseudolycoriella hygida]
MGKISETELDRQLDVIEAEFLCSKPIELIEWKDVLHPDNMTLSAQNKLMSKTINSSEFKSRKTKLSHRLRFLRHIIDTLERQNVDIEDGLYEIYTNLLQNSDNEVEFCKIYKLIEFQTSVCLPHSDEIIKHGTTGFYTWEASCALSEWALANMDQFKGKQILELGCGTGLCGFVIHRTCDPKFIYLTDGNEMVFNELIKTRDINYVEKGAQNLDIQMLDWYKINESKLVETFTPDVIIAADIIYDNTLFEPLSRTIETFFNKSKNCKLYMACTVRNEDTINEFLNILDAMRFKRSEEEPVAPTHIYYNNATPIKIFSFVK